MATPKKPAAPAKAPSRSTRTRKDVKDEFDDLVDNQDDTPADPKTAALAKARAAQVKAKTQDVTPKIIVDQLAAVGLGIQKTLSDVQAQLLAELNNLDELREAAEVEKAEIEALHRIDVASAAIDVLIQEHAEKTAALEKEYADKQAELEKTIQARTEEEARAAADAQSSREREEADYVYRTKLARRKAEDEFAQKQQGLERQLAERKEQLEKGWTERENVLKAAEKDLADLRAQVAAMPETVRKEKEAAVAVATNSLKKDLTAAFALEKKDLEQNIALARQAQAAFQAQNDTLTKRIAQLEAELDKARESVKEMAVASFKEAGASRALAEVTSFGQGRDNGAPARKS